MVSFVPDYQSTTSSFMSVYPRIALAGIHFWPSSQENQIVFATVQVPFVQCVVKLSDNTAIHFPFYASERKSKLEVCMGMRMGKFNMTRK
jgi:hypothetical protein